LGAVEFETLPVWTRDGWHAKYARELARRAKGIRVEALLPFTGGPPGAARYVTDEGIKQRILPVDRIDPPRYLALAREINRTYSASDPVILHVHDLRSPSLYYFLLLVNPRIPIFVQDHGHLFPSPSKMPFEAFFFRRSARIYVLTRLSRDYLLSIGLPESKVEVRTMGVDSDFFRPLAKSQCREKVGLPQGGRIMLYVGPFNDYRGLDVILRSFEQIRRKYDVALVCVGGSRDQPLYNEIKKATPYVFERLQVGPELMPILYNAADLTCWFYSFPRLFWTAGVGMPILESLSCGTPVVSSTLIHLEGTLAAESVGRQVVSSRDFTGAVVDVLTTGRNPVECRRIVERNYSWDRIIGLTLKDYVRALGS